MDCEEFLMKFSAASGDIPPEKDIVSAVMLRIAHTENSFAENRNIVSMKNWISTGIVIVTGTCLIPFSTFLPSLIHDTPWLRIILPLVLGSAVTIYAMLFTGSHMKDLTRLLRLR